MGFLTYPLTGLIAIDANILIYSVEQTPLYFATLNTFWLQVSQQRMTVLTSELTALEVLVRPLRTGDAVLEAQFRQALFNTSNLQLMPITLNIIERAARLRADIPALKTPDAIHAATALEAGATTFISNDPAFQKVPGLNVIAPSALPHP